jgi:hypothetical protein
MAPSEHVKVYNILSDNALSNHLPINFFIEVQETKTFNSRYKLNGAFLQDPAVTMELAALWQSFPSSSGFLGNYTSWLIGIRHTEEVGLQAHMSRAQEHLQLNSVDPTAQQELASALDSFRSFDAYKLEGQQIQAEVK